MNPEGELPLIQETQPAPLGKEIFESELKQPIQVAGLVEQSNANLEQARANEVEISKLHQDIKKMYDSKVESRDREIVTHNIEMLNKDMLDLLGGESIGGNAGDVEIDGKFYSCAGANGYADKKTGKIIVFGNIQDIKDKNIIENNLDFTLRVAVNSEIMASSLQRPRVVFDRESLVAARLLAKEEDRKSFFKIVDFFGKEKFEITGQNNIAEAIEIYNNSSIS